MKKLYSLSCAFAYVVFISSTLQVNTLQAQCNNADFSDGNYTGWTGTYSNVPQVCTSTFLGVCLSECSATNPTGTAGFNPGPTDDPVNDANNHYNHVITSTAGGNDPYLSSAFSVNLPTVWPGGPSTYSCRMGGMWQAIGADGEGDGETTSYTFVVTPANCNFTYHYAVVLNDGGHPAGQQPYFNINMMAGTDTIQCAAYEVDATTAATIGGFTTENDPTYGTVYFKPWSSVFIPLNNYIGQTVTITFTTRSCLPSGCAGSHFAYAYISAECAPLTLVASTPTVCGGQNLTLTAPAGAATYHWTGPGIVSGATSQVVTIDQPGEYVVAMTTFGNVPCDFSLDTFMAGNPANPIANFTAPTVCAGNPTTFTDMSTPAPSISAWSWNFGDGGTSNLHNPSHTYATTGTFPVTLTVTSTPCTKDTVIDVTVSPPPTSPFTATSPVCEGSASTITYTGNGLVGDTYTWNFDGGTATPGTGQGPQSVTWTTSGTKNVTLTVSAGSCSSTVTTQQVVVEPFPGITLTPYTTICAGSTATLVASGATTYAWAPDATLTTTGTPGTVTVAPTSTDTYTVTGTSNNCVSVDTVTVAVYPIPTSTFTAPGPLCTGVNTPVTYTGNAGAGATYTWNFAGGNVTPATGGQGPFQENWSTAGTPAITLTVSQFGCTSTQTSVPVTVNPTPTSTFTASSPLCLGQNSTVTFTGSADAAAVYTWGFGTGTIVTGTAGTAGPYTINWANAGTQSVTLSVTDNGCTAPTTTVPVTIYPIPTSTFTATSPVCVGASSIVLYTGTATPGATLTWNFSGGTGTPDTGMGPLDISWAAAGTPNISLTVSQNGCTSTPTTVPVTVNPIPTSTFTATGPVCTGQASTVTYTGTADNLGTYTWNFSGGVATPGTGQGPQSVTWTNAGTQNITLQVSENGCTSPVTSVPVIVNPVPTANFTATSPLCVGQNGTITYTGTSTPSAVYTWGFSNGNVVSGSGKGPYTINWSAASVGTQMLSLAVTDQGCVATPDSVPVVINPIPVSTPGDDTAYCSGGGANIGAPAVAGYTYLWQPATGLNDATSASPVVSLTNPGSSDILTQTYTVTTTSLGCVSTGSVTVTVNPVPVAQFVAPAPQCLTGNSFTFKTIGSNLNSAIYAWSFGANATPPVASSPTQTVAYNTAGTYGVTLAVTQVGCVDSLSQSVTVNPEPQLAFAPDTVIGCENFEVCFNNTSQGVMPLTYDWHFGDGQTSSQQSPCHLYADPGVYSVYLKLTSSQLCTYDTTVVNLIKVIADPVAKFTSNVTIVQQPESEIDFTNESSNSVRYLWDFNTEGVSDATIGNSTNINPVFNFTQYGLYNVELHAYNMLGCADSITEVVTVLPPQSFFIPNAFTPNGDGRNDLFYIEMQEGVTVHSFQVFDRWGEKVHDGQYPWDGTFKGKPSQEGVYVYVFKLRLVDMNVDIERKGSVTLIR